MDPLKELWSLYETVMEKPPLQDEAPVTVDTPEDQDYEHPVSQERRKLSPFHVHDEHQLLNQQ